MTKTSGRLALDLSCVEEIASCPASKFVRRRVLEVAMKNGIARVLLVIFVNVFAGISAFGQAVNTAQIHGRVTDPSGAVVAEAQVQARQVATGQIRTTVTNADGQYSLPGLPLGAYDLEVTGSGFQKYLQKRGCLKSRRQPLFIRVPDGEGYAFKQFSEPSFCF